MGRFGGSTKSLVLMSDDAGERQRKKGNRKKEGREERHKSDFMCAPSFAIVSIVPVVQTLDARMIVPRERN